MKHILILGGNRFVGKSLTTSLYEKGYNITVLNRTGTSPVNCNTISCDRNDLEKLEEYLDNHYFDIIIDMCLYNEEQAHGNFPILKKICGKYIFMSSIASKIKDFKEYGTQKRKVEKLISKNFSDYVILQPTYIIGEDDPTNRLKYYADCLDNNYPIKLGSPDINLINFIDSNDLKHIIIKLIEKDKKYNKIYELGGEEVLSLQDFVGALALIKKVSLYQIDTSPKNIPNNIYKNFSCVTNNRAIKKELNIKFTPLFETISRIL